MDSASHIKSHLPWLAVLLGLGVVAYLYDHELAVWLGCYTANHPGAYEAARFLSDWGNYVFYVGFGLALAAGVRRRDWGLIRLGLTYGLTLLLFSLLAGHLMKIAVGRPRPYAGASLPCHPLSLEGRYASFPSGHTSDAFAAVVPSLRWLRSILLRGGVLLWAAAIAVSRIMLAQHYPTDVVAGASLSLVGGYAVARWVERWLPDVVTPGRLLREAPHA